ncbi:MAG TPA: diaminopimelate epimerase [Gemmatimonadales bacterium]|nr:diaminopimelate epimerase [Gemmatimonadales bacterium]
MTGSGNDFVMVDSSVSGPDDWAESDIQAVCARGTGVGADGLVFVGPGKAAGAVRMVYFNSDGSRASMCGNAALCSTRLAAYLGIGPQRGMQLETDAGTYVGRCGQEPDRAEIQLSPVEPPTEPALDLMPGEERAGLTVVGVPHLIVLVRDVDQVDLAGRGRELRYAPALGPDGANVNFVSPGRRSVAWRMRTYERGVEGETLACGTGAVAAACILEHWGLERLPVVIETRSQLPLEVHARKSTDGAFEDVWLKGQARMVFRGIVTA